MGTKNSPGEFDCYANAGPDEPLFVLLGRDRHAPGLVRLWALLRHNEDERLPLVDRNEAQISEALECADAMETHARSIGKDPVKNGLAFEALFIALTDGMVEHPEGFAEPCHCDLCRSYD